MMTSRANRVGAHSETMIFTRATHKGSLQPISMICPKVAGRSLAESVNLPARCCTLLSSAVKMAEFVQQLDLCGHSLVMAGYLNYLFLAQTVPAPELLKNFLVLRAGQSARHPTCRRNQSGSDRHHGNDHRNGGRVAAEGHARVGRGSGSSIRSQFSHHSGLTHDPGVEPASSGARVADSFARYPHAIASSYAPARSACPHGRIADCDHHRCLRVV
jgi:hypothetical protein